MYYYFSRCQYISVSQQWVQQTSVLLNLKICSFITASLSLRQKTVQEELLKLKVTPKYLVKDEDCLEQIQIRATKLVIGFKKLTRRQIETVGNIFVEVLERLLQFVSILLTCNVYKLGLQVSIILGID